MAKRFRSGGFGGGGGIPNMGNLMKQAQKMQEDMAKTKESLSEMTVEASAGGGAISVVATGNKEITEILIKPEVVDPDDVEMLQDLIVAAVNEAIRKADELNEREIGKITGGMGGGLPGLF